MTSAPIPVPAQREPELAGQTVVVIGGSAGIGLETARRARAEGADVILTGRNPDRLQQAALELGAERTAAFDATDPPALDRFLRDHILDRNMKIGERAKEHYPHLPERLRPRCASRHWRVEQQVRLDDLVDRLRDDLRIAGVHGVMEAARRTPAQCTDLALAGADPAALPVSSAW